MKQSPTEIAREVLELFLRKSGTLHKYALILESEDIEPIVHELTTANILHHALPTEEEFGEKVKKHLDPKLEARPMDGHARSGALWAFRILRTHVNGGE